MARLLTPKLLLRGFEFFLVASLLGYGLTLLYGNDVSASLAKFAQLEWPWLFVGVGLASMDWLGGGLRLWVLARHVVPSPSLKGCLLAGGMGAWAGYVTPLQSGAGPMTIYTLRRYGIPLPVAVAATFVSFIATIAFFGIAGPLAILFGAGRSLGTKGNVLGLSLYDLFLGSLGVVGIIGLVMLVIVVFPHFAAGLIHRLADSVGRRSRRVAERLEKLRAGIEDTAASVVAFKTPKGLLALVWATVLSGPSHANKLLAGYVALRVLGIHANFVDVLLVQTLVMFLLYFAPTPGASGIAELLTAAVMSVYVPRELTPVYTLVWRFIQSYCTIGFGFIVFSGWVRRGLRVVDETALPEAAG
ncbi:MAG TPA: lysylphosphatidylglycerol synthase transmembrane domain-containing protein [Gemmatimonadales bacterium]|nr:lysylphosphatidylglycerol synthase transmembrane domain-containing protein [Gemmatimonadales bacterium]